MHTPESDSTQLNAGRTLKPAPCLRPWMKWLLRFGGTYNMLAGLAMLTLYHEGYKLLGLAKPALVMPVQLVGILVALFGVGYLLVASAPLENRNLLVLGFWSKALGSLLGLFYLAVGKMPLVFLPVLFMADIVYLPPYLLIIRHLRRMAKETRQRHRWCEARRMAA